MSEKEKLQQSVIETVRNSETPLTPQEVESKIGRDGEVRDAIVSLVDRGTLKVTLDWKLRVS
jgi:hypothetical protein